MLDQIYKIEANQAQVELIMKIVGDLNGTIPNVRPTKGCFLFVNPELEISFMHSGNVSLFVDTKGEMVEPDELIEKLRSIKEEPRAFNRYDKVYVMGHTKIFEVQAVDPDCDLVILAINETASLDLVGFVPFYRLALATPENYEHLTATFTGLEFEKPIV